MSNKLSNPAQESLGDGQENYYVYALVDPRSQKIFYIGKGKENRVFNHVQEASDNPDSEKTKLTTIREIEKSGKKVLQYIIRSSLSEEEALFLEACLIDVLNFKGFKLNTALSNIVLGHHRDKEKLLIEQFKTTIVTTDELNSFYKTEPLTVFKHKVMAININKTYKSASEPHPNIYEAVRKSWRVNLARAEQAELVLAEYKGVVRAIFRPWRWYSEDGKRYMFEGEKVEDKEIIDLYLNKIIKRAPGNISPVRYFGYGK